MEVIVTDDGAYAHLKPVGRIESSNAMLFEQTLMAHLVDARRSVLIDLSGVDFVSSAGLRVFLLGAKKANGTSVNMVVCAMDANIRRIFAMSGFDRILMIAEDVEQGQRMMHG